MSTRGCLIWRITRAAVTGCRQLTSKINAFWHKNVEGAASFRCRRRDLVLVAVRSTAESQSATKKPHKMGKSAEKNRRISTSEKQKLYFLLNNVFPFKCGFCSALNEAAPSSMLMWILAVISRSALYPSWLAFSKKYKIRIVPFGYDPNLF